MNTTASSLLKNIPLNNLNRIFLVVLAASIVLGLFSGYILAKSSKSSGATTAVDKITNQAPKTAQQDNRTFRDFAEGTLAKRPTPKSGEDYAEGTHLLIRNGAVPVALTSSVVDLSQYEGKKVKVFGETQKAIKEGWLMDVGKVEVK